MTIPRLNRRELLVRFETPGEPEPLSGADCGVALARKLLTQRAHAAYYAVARPWPEDSEALVHDARVACRRLVETLELAAPLFGSKATKRAQARAKRLRQALGAAREADVMRGDLQGLGRQSGLPTPALEALGEAIGGHSEAAPDPQEIYAPERLYRFGLDLLELAEEAAPLPLSELAAAHLARRAIAARPFVLSVADRRAVDAHHRLRIRLKHLRYTLELLAEPYEAELEAARRLEILKRLQDALGDLNDAADLGSWVATRDLDEGLAALPDAIQTEREARYERARRQVLEHAPLLVSDLEQAALRIGG